MLEKQIQKQILDYLQGLYSYGVVYFFRSGSGKLKVKGGYFKTGRNGCPDITVICKGKFIGIEVKTKDGVQSVAQLKAQREIEKAGGFYYIVTSVEEVEKIINQAR